jgi:DNA-binding response OmpR family regulator
MAVLEEHHGARILVVDDDPDLVTYLETFLEDNGFSVLTASNAGEGMNKAKAEFPDLITLDLSMPGKSGSEFFRELRTDPGTKGIPVFVITGVNDFRKYIYQRRIEPPEGYMDKPIQPGELLTTIRKILSRWARSEEEI